MTTIDEARIARDKLSSQLDPSLKAAVGIGGLPGQYTLEVRIPKIPLTGTLPDQIDGISIEVRVIGNVIAAGS